MKFDQFSIDGKVSDLFRTLNLDEYLELSKRGGGSVPPEIIDKMFAIGGRQWIHFVPVRSGKLYVKGSNADGSQFIRFNVTLEKVTPRGGVILVSDNDQHREVLVSSYDSLEVEIPGQVDSDWSIRMDNGEPGLKNISIVENNRSPSVGPRVKLTLRPVFKTYESTNLYISRGRTVYEFKIKTKPVPVC